MADFVLKKGDLANFLPTFPPANVVPKPGPLKASASNVRINGKKVCLAGDEGKVKVGGCLYMAGAFVIPGTGTLKIARLSGNQKSKKVKCNGKPLLLKGGQFQSECKVGSQAKNPGPPPVPDPNPKYNGKGMFVTTNVNVKAS